MATMRAFWTGLRDGVDQPYDLSMGMSYDDDRLQASYDYGANVGQRVGRLHFKATRIWRSPPL